MSRILLGSICGVIFGFAVVLMMLPMEFSDKQAALLGAFLNRFGVGFVIGAAKLPLPGWATGLVFGLLLSLPDAIIDGETGLLVDPLDSAAIGAAVRQLVDDPVRARAMGETGRRRALEHFNWKTVAARIDAITTSLVRT